MSTRRVSIANTKDNIIPSSILSLYSLPGLLIKEPKLWTANMVGVILGVYYFTSFVRTAPKGMKSSTLPGSINLHIEFVLMIAAYVLFFAKNEKTLPIGQLGVLINLAVSAVVFCADGICITTELHVQQPS
jgi:hypothetical protein